MDTSVRVGAVTGAAIARAEPIDYPAETRGLNFFDLDLNLRRLLWRRAPGLLGFAVIEV
ncbi:MAG: hypothetical protein ACTSU0_07970 [Alphaproteobacteria bacterium]